MLDTQPAAAPTDAPLQTPRLPRATYRIQFHGGFTFRDAQRCVAYLDELGISDVYASPYLKARSGSRHGYDVADPNALNPEVGSQQEYDDFVAELQQRGMGHVLDVVPNHMGIADEGNHWWMDVLENGPSSLYASFFDIDWNPLKPEINDRDKVVLPILGDQYGRVLQNGELSVSYEDGAFFLSYYDLRLPLSPRSYTQLLGFKLDDLETLLGSDNEHFLELQSIITALSHLPPRDVQDPRKVKERNREKEIIKRRIARLHQECPEFGHTLNETLETFNHRNGAERSFDLLDRLLSEQAYRLAFWRVASEEINYRRFFDISELAALRMEDPHVFAEIHRLLLALVREGKISGLRIDHVDGLLDPLRYLWRLQKHCFIKLGLRERQLSNGTIGDDERLAERELEALYDRLRTQSPSSPAVRPMYVAVEKILGPEEELGESWPVYGTTGYEFLAALNGIFVDRSNRSTFDTIYSRFIRSSARFPDLINSNKKMVMLISLASEVNELAYQLKRIASRNPMSRDFTLNGLTFVIREIIASLPVYRTYIDSETGEASEHDRVYLEAAVVDAKRRNPRTDPSPFDFVRDTLLLARPAASAEERAEQLKFIAKFQQTTGPVMAKGVEDTTFYVYNRLISLNEVGADPDRFGNSVTAFHRQNARRLERWPFSLLATSTHDTKRSEDVRARINVLSELPKEWRAALTRWSRLNGRRKVAVDARTAPDRNEEYLLYQTLLGAWPFETMDDEAYAAFVSRIVGFMQKALKEAKVHTSWINPNVPYEEAVQRFVESVLDRSGPNSFLDDFHVLQARVAHFGIFNALSQVLLKIASPGVPDIYQGNETWDLSLVDPDNRRPVDYELHQGMLRDLGDRLGASKGDLLPFVKDLLDGREDGLIKLYVTHAALGIRREHPALFSTGSYVGLRATGAKKHYVCAFARQEDGACVIVAAPVMVAGLTRGATVVPLGHDVWADTALVLPGPLAATYRNCFTGREVTVRHQNGKNLLGFSEVFEHFPVALLERV